MPVSEVVVESVLVRDVQPYIEATGVTNAHERVEIPARVSGFLKEIRYAAGNIVAAGAPLFIIQPEQYQADVKASEGALLSAQASLKLAEANFARTQRLVAQGASTQEDLDTATAQRDAAAAAITQAEAALDIAKLNLSYTDVRSPIKGKVDPSAVDVGTMVGPTGNKSMLTTVAGMDPIHVRFDISDSQFNSIQAYAREHKTPAMAAALQQLQAAGQQGSTPTSSGLEEFQIPFEMSLIVGSTPETGEYPYKGVIETTNNTIDPSTGTITVRGKIPNGDYAIFPGQICRVRIPIWTTPDALLVRQEAIGTDMNQRYVYVVDDKNTVHRRVIELGPLQAEGTRVVTKGLEKGERYIVNGIQKVRDGSQVKIRE
jgi:RND family efflux transporter MFP subunit